MKKFSLFIGLTGLVVLVGLSAASCKRAAPTDTTSQTSTTTSTDQTGQTGDASGGLNGINLPPDGNGGTGNTNGTDANAPIAGLPDAAAAKLAMQQELSTATAKIHELKDDLVLQLVSMKFVNSLSDSSGLATNYYIFASPSDTNYYYLVNVPHNGESPKRFLMPKGDLDLPFDLIPVQTQYWKMSYVDALTTIDTKGASDFRAKHTKYEVSAILAAPAGQYLNWFITYRATDGSGDVFQASVDSASGDVKIVK